MAYVVEVEITNLKTVVAHLQQKFSNLVFDAHYEAIYGLGRFYTHEEGEELDDSSSRFLQ